MPAGPRNQLVSFESFTATQDEYNEDVLTWSEICEEWAQIFYGRGDERRQAAMEQGVQPAVFQVLSNEDTRSVEITNRIVHQGVNWDIVGIAPDFPQIGLIEFTATRAA